MSEFEIRPYAPSDREAIRRISFETGYLGEPIDWLWRDRESFADRITRYCTEREPGSCTGEGGRMHLQWMTRSL